MTVLRLARSYGVRVTRRLPEAVEFIGNGLNEADLCRQGDQLLIGYYPRGYHDNVLHELCHALCGPKSLRDETALLALQWKLMQALTPRDYRACRQDFGHYILGPDRIGWDDDIFRTEDWWECVCAAKRQGLLTQRGTVRKNLTWKGKWS